MFDSCTRHDLHHFVSAAFSFLCGFPSSWCTAIHISYQFLLLLFVLHGYDVHSINTCLLLAYCSVTKFPEDSFSICHRQINNTCVSMHCDFSPSDQRGVGDVYSWNSNGACYG